MKFCKDCKHCEVKESDYRSDIDFSKCNHPKNYLVNGDYLSTGNKSRKWTYSSTMRDHEWPFDWLFKMCGKRGRWFEPKDTKEDDSI